MTVNGKRKTRGFTIVELLVALLVIGVMTSIGVSSIRSLTSESKLAKNKENAKTIVSTVSSAMTAGSPEILAAANKEEAVTLILAGVQGTGQFATMNFRVNLNTTEAERQPHILVLRTGCFSTSTGRIAA